MYRKKFFDWEFSGFEKNGNYYYKSIIAKIGDLVLEKYFYKVNVKINGTIYKGVLYPLNNESIKIYLYDCKQENDFSKIECCILFKISIIKTFKIVEQFNKQLKNILDYYRYKKNYVLTFGTFDFFHEGHKYFLNESKFFGDNLIVIIARDENVKKFKGIYPFYNEITRKKNLLQANITKNVYLGKKSNPMFWLKEYNPSIICLGYDQKGFSYLIDKYIKKHNMKINIIKISPYKEDIYKSSLIRKKYFNS